MTSELQPKPPYMWKLSHVNCSKHNYRADFAADPPEMHANQGQDRWEGLGWILDGPRSKNHPHQDSHGFHWPGCSNSLKMYGPIQHLV